MITTSLRVSNCLSEISRIARAVRLAADQAGMHQEAEADLQISIDEIVSNIIRHGLPNDALHEVKVTISGDQNRVIVRIVDGGIPFNPQQHGLRKRVGAPDFERIGGLGIHFVMQIVDELKYTRRKGCNYTMLRKNVTDKTEA